MAIMAMHRGACPAHCKVVGEAKPGQAEDDDA